MKDQKIKAFLDELTALSHKHGLGLTRAQTFELEAEDAERAYQMDDDSLVDFV
jgi:hypothetical protein